MEGYRGGTEYDGRLEKTEIAVENPGYGKGTDVMERYGCDGKCGAWEKCGDIRKGVRVTEG